MSRRFFMRYLPPPQHLKEHKHLRHLGERLTTPNLWYLNRRSVAVAVSIGLFISFIPLPGHMLMAAVAAIWLRVNLPVSVLMVWFNNPLTMGPIYFFNYKVGTWLLGGPVHEMEFEATWQWLQTKFLTIWQPLLLGSLVMGLTVGVAGSLLTLGLWRIGVWRRWKDRKKQRMLSQVGR